MAREGKNNQPTVKSFKYFYMKALGGHREFGKFQRMLSYLFIVRRQGHYQLYCVIHVNETKRFPHTESVCT